MKYYLVHFLAMSLVLASVHCTHAQINETAKDESIARMKHRIAEIEKEMQGVGFEQAQKLGAEAFGLLGEIDSTFLQLKNEYQRQVVLLNQRMQQKWEQVESAKYEDRGEIEKQLKQLEQDWELTFERLTAVHEAHLDQLKDALAKVRGEFSVVAGKAQAELVASSLEARARWEHGHEIFLAVNKTYVRIVGDQVRWLEKQLKVDPTHKEVRAKLTEIRDRYLELQARFQQRNQYHLGNLDEELKVRLAQLNVSEIWESRRAIYLSIDDLYKRSQSTYEDLQASMRDSLRSMHLAKIGLPTNSERKLQLETKAASLKTALVKSYRQRVVFIESICGEIEIRIAGSGNEVHKSTWTARVTDLRLLARDLLEKAEALERPPAARTAST